MRKVFILIVFCLFGFSLLAGTVEKTYTFSSFSTKISGIYTMISFDHTLLTGNPGEPMLPYHSVSLLLPPGEKAQSIEIIRENEIFIPGTFILFPQQHYRPVSDESSGDFIKNDKVYSLKTNYPSNPAGHLLTQYLNGYSFALSTFTPIQYNPSTGRVSYFQKVTVRIATFPSEESSAALKNLVSFPANTKNQVKEFAQNPELLDVYPAETLKQSSYQLMIITPAAFQNGFNDLVTYYGSKGMEARVITTESIYSQATGIDNQEKIRNYIIQEYQNNGIKYVLLGGGAQWVPFRGFFCFVESGGGYTDPDIPADLYYSGVDGNYDANGNQVYGEVGDEPDLLPDIAVARFPFSSEPELAAMVHKTVSYQDNPVLGELKQPFMVGEFLTSDPAPTWGGDYLELMLNDHNDHGYFTHGIPSATNSIERMYDSPVGSWDKYALISKINQGKSFIHHLGHSSTDYMLRLNTSDITNENFSGVNGIDHNYTILYTQGCYCGAFDQYGCVAVKSVTIENFLVAGIFNSRYGWFNQGTTDGPSQHLQREFVSALYTDTIPEKHIGATHMISKIKTAPWVTAPGEFEPGAQRWCHYCSNVFGDPALSIWTDEPEVGIQDKNRKVSLAVYPNPAREQVFVTCKLPVSTDVHVEIMNLFGQVVSPPIDFQSQTRGEHKFPIQLSNLVPGIYLVKLKTSISEESCKLTILE